MNPAQAMALINARTAKLAAPAAVPDVASLQQAANHAAGLVRALAARNGHSVGIRVLAKTNGVRISVSGHQAHRYRSIVTAELERLKPATAAEVKASIVRKIR